MDDPVRRRSFVRLATAETIQTAGRLAGMGALAGNLVANGLASLAAVGASEETQGTEGTAPTPASAAQTTPRPAAATPPPPAPMTSGRLDAATTALLASTNRLLIAVNRAQAGPLVLSQSIRMLDDVVHLDTRGSSAIAAAVRAAPHVTLLVDDPEAGQRVMVFGTAQVLEGPALAGTDPERARIDITPSHAVRIPL